MSILKLSKGGFVLYSPLAPTEECIAKVSRTQPPKTPSSFRNITSQSLTNSLDLGAALQHPIAPMLITRCNPRAEFCPIAPVRWSLWSSSGEGDPGVLQPVVLLPAQLLPGALQLRPGADQAKPRRALKRFCFPHSHASAVTGLHAPSPRAAAVNASAEIL
jgi:hypothetical protein